ncbi:MAG: response regulator [Bacteroidota bacterium]
MKVLICEDDQVVSTLLVVILKKKNIVPVCVSDGRQALRQLRENSFDLIITDIHMPYHNGDEILSLVRNEQGKKTPIIMMSSDTEEEVIDLALKLGVNAFVKKPLKEAEVEKVIRKFL